MPPQKMCPYSITKHERIIITSFIPKGSERDYQLWVNSGKEEAPYPLIGKFLQKSKMRLCFNYDSKCLRKLVMWS